MLQTWYYAVLTGAGIYDGSVNGEREELEANEHAQQEVASLARQFVQGQYPDEKILACMVSDSPILIDAQGELVKLDMEVTINVNGFRI